jgi:hypothetical protein
VFIRFIAAAILFAMAGVAADYRIEGTVVNGETGLAIQGARVQAFSERFCCGAMAEGETVSGDDGHFSIPISEGRWSSVRTSLQGYMLDSADELSECSPCTIAVSLHALANISGRVVSADTKEPLVRAVVEPLSATYSSKLLRSVPSGGARTDQNGTFTLALPPGQYFFRFTAADIAGSVLAMGPADRSAPEYVRQFWPGGDDYKNATPFTVVGGTDFRLPDIWLPALPRFRVTGTVEANMCAGGDAYTVSIGVPRGSAFAVLRTTLVHCGDEFVFADLAPGRYQISLLPKDGGEALRRDEVVVTDGNLQKNFGK